MDLLMIGGTVFLGRAVVEDALARGHTVTTFTRGRSNPDLFDGKVKQLTGDRRADLSALETGTWDAVVDTCGYFPSDVESTTALLKGRAGRYVFISSVSAYDDSLAPDSDEDAAVAELAPGEPADQITGATYGPLKVLCERAATDAFGDAAWNIRPGLIVGPHDPTDRFTYWPVRLSQPGPAIAPKTTSRTQFIDVRDLGAWIVSGLERGIGGTFNATGPAISWEEFFDACTTAATPEWIDEGFLIDQGMEPWGELPGWLPAGEDGMSTVSSARAVAAGLACRPLRETAADTLAWARTWPEGTELRAGMKPEREAEILAAWRARN
jgi:2'-hydroxyisoflavone reductase